MSKPELTKLLIAATVKKLAAKNPIDKISVADITEEAGINRKTFYYHFTDKAELICWIFDYDTSNITDKANNNTLFDDIIEYIYSEKHFYISALTSSEQNNLSEHIYKACHQRMMTDIQRILGERTLSTHYQQVFAALFTHGIIGMLTSWAKDGMKKDSYEFITEYAVLISEILASTINTYV